MAHNGELFRPIISFSIDISLTTGIMSMAIRYESVAMGLLIYIPMEFGRKELTFTTKPAAVRWFVKVLNMSHNGESFRPIISLR